MLEPWYYESYTGPRPHRTRERGSGSPDLEVRGPDALPLSRDALQLRTSRNARLPRKPE